MKHHIVSAAYCRDFTEQGWVEYCLAQQIRHVREMARMHQVRNKAFEGYLNRTFREHCRNAAGESKKAVFLK